jgi:hypothetical protein
VRRRARSQLLRVPAELWTFTPGDWSEFAPTFDERVDFEGCTADEPLRRKLREFRVWADARRTWADAHGWPCDSVDMLRDEVVQKMALVERGG